MSTFLEDRDEAISKMTALRAEAANHIRAALIKEERQAEHEKKAADSALKRIDLEHEVAQLQRQIREHENWSAVEMRLAHVIGRDAHTSRTEAEGLMLQAEKIEDEMKEMAHRGK